MAGGRDDELPEQDEENDFDEESQDELELKSNKSTVEDDDEDDDEPPSRLETHVRRADIRSARDLFGEEICARARGQQRLREHLKGTILVSIDGKERYLFDWSADDPRCTPNAQGDKADCRIEMHEEDLLKILSGMLNPQIAMLSDKMTIFGRGELAVYFFNLVAARH